MRSARFAVLAGVVMAFGCSPPPVTQDSGTPDAGSPADSGTPMDSGTPDSGTPDGGTPDSGAPDSGSPDSGTPDAGNPDSGTADSGTPDAGPPQCTAPGPSRGSAIALTSDDKRLISVNRDVGTVTVMSVDYTTSPSLNVVGELTVGAEPWQVAIGPCNTTAYVVLRKDQKVVEITNLEGTPVVGRSVSVGSEPTSLAITPNGTRLIVSNWVDGTLTVVDPHTMTALASVDLNGALAYSGLLGPVTPRPALAHPRGIAITNNGDLSDDDETVYVTEWFAVRTAPESATGTASDTNWKGLLYAVKLSDASVSLVDLPPVLDTGFTDAKGQATGCFPNQIGAVTIDGAFAYVLSTCASPVGPVGVFQKGACTIDAQCSGGLPGACVNGACKSSCTVDSDCGFGSSAGACDIANGFICRPLTANAKTTTHPGLSIVDLATHAATTVNLDKRFSDATQTTSGTAPTRMPLLPMDLGFKPGGFGYLAAEGADALFRVTTSMGALGKVGGQNNNFIDLRPSTLPIGVALSPTQAVAFVANEGTREVVAVDLVNQVAYTGAGLKPSSALPAAGSPEASALAGKRFFTTGLGRWSLQGAAWGSCAACHVDGLSDNVTWYFARGPRQTISLDGTFAKAADGGVTGDQRILNWSGMFDEIADFEANVRGVSGGIGALVSTNSTPPVASDRINLLAQSPRQQGLEGSSQDVAAPDGGSMHPHTVISDWLSITDYLRQVRTPRAPTTLNPNDVNAGRTLFQSQGNCIGCHSGPKWTISKVFYAPSDVPNDAFGSVATTSLSNTSWLNRYPGFPMSLYPSTTPGKQVMRSGTPGTFEQLQCVLRKVGTIGVNGSTPTGVSPMAVGVIEVRQDMTTAAQGAGTNANDSFGFNPPSMLGLSVGAPYFHAGNARTLEELFSTTFQPHHQALTSLFTPDAQQTKQLVAFLLSIDGTTAYVPIPAAGANGGDLCAYP